MAAVAEMGALSQHPKGVRPVRTSSQFMNEKSVPVSSPARRIAVAEIFGPTSSEGRRRSRITRRKVRLFPDPVSDQSAADNRVPRILTKLRELVT